MCSEKFARREYEVRAENMCKIVVRNKRQMAIMFFLVPSVWFNTAITVCQFRYFLVFKDIASSI
jgi:hypothetical protein